VIWLIPQVVMVQSMLFLIASGIAMWIIYKENFLKEFFSNFKQNWFIFPFVAFAFASIFWSILFESSIFRWIIFISTIVLGLYISFQYSMREFIKILSAFSIMIFVLSMIFIVTIPSLSVMDYFPYEGTWQGIYWHKNHLGLITTLMNILFLIIFIETIKSPKPNKYVWGFLYLASLFFLYKTGAVGAYLTTIFIHGVFVLLYTWLKIRHRLKIIQYIFFVCLLLIALVIVFLNLDLIFGLFGRSSSLTGRIPMWMTLYETYFTKQPYLGYGFNAFWYYYPHRANMQSLIGWSNPPVISDNGFFDILINTGIIGFSLFCLFYLSLWYRSLRLLKNASNSFDLFPITFMVYTFVGNLSFSLIFETEAYIMLIMMVLYFSLNTPNKYFSWKQE
jgi:O-antigen ligase